MRKAFEECMQMQITQNQYYKITKNKTQRHAQIRKIYEQMQITQNQPTTATNINKP